MLLREIEEAAAKTAGEGETRGVEEKGEPAKGPAKKWPRGGPFREPCVLRGGAAQLVPAQGQQEASWEELGQAMMLDC